MERLLAKYAALRAPEGGGNGGGGGSEGGGGNPPAWAPQGMDAKYLGATAEETLGKLYGGFNEVNTRATGLRDQLARLPKAPEKPELYTFTPSDKTKPYFGGSDADNKVMDFARQAFHKHGIPQEAFAGVIEDLYGPMIDGGLLAPPYDAAREIANFSELTGLDKAGTASALADADQFATGLMAQLKDVPEKVKADVQATLMSLTDSAAGNILLRALSGRLAENGIRVAGEGGGQGELTGAELKKMAADPRIDPKNREHPDPAKRYDEDLRRRYDEGHKKLSAKAPAAAAW